MVDAIMHSILNLCMWTGAAFWAITLIRGVVTGGEYITKRIQRARWRRQHRQMWPELYAHEQHLDAGDGELHGLLTKWADEEYDDQRQQQERIRSHMQRRRLAEWSLRDSLHSDPHGDGDDK